MSTEARSSCLPTKYRIEVQGESSANPGKSFVGVMDKRGRATDYEVKRMITSRDNQGPSRVEGNRSYDSRQDHRGDLPRDIPLVSEKSLRSVLTDPEVHVKMEMEIPRSSGVNSQPHAHT
ncbi:hypothetical protein Tco_0564312 [Tanacetum coccineum]